LIERRLQSGLDIGLIGGVDIRKEPFEVIPEHHYQNGGIKIGEHGETAVEGLYAAGEQTGGVHGGNRLGTNSLPDLLVFGKRAGEAAAFYVKDIEGPKIEEGQIEEEIKKICGPLERGDGVSPYSLSKRLHEIMWEEMGIARSEKGLRRCLDTIKEIDEDFSKVSVPAKSLKYNDAWMTAQEVRTRIFVGELMARSSLMRTESRAALYREDYPSTNRKDWDKNIVVTQEGGQMKLETQPVVVTILPLEEVELPVFPMPGK
jgi:succinate dehydrogenase/fumarate reductase flavoprotein subunit